MGFPRRSLLLGGLLVLVGCTGDPRVDVDPDATPRVQRGEEPAQDPAFAAAAASIAALRAEVDRHDSGPWREAALAQCVEQLARFNSLTPFGEPEPVFSPEPGQATDLPAAVESAVTTLVGRAAEAPDVGQRLLLLSAAAATSGLRDTTALPGTGGEPGHVDSLGDQWPVALGHAWALVHGIEIGLGRLDSDDDLHAALDARLASAKGLRNELREGIDGVAPSQPASFALPTAMGSAEEIRDGWATLEVRLLEALVLLAADDDAAAGLWEPQVVRAQAAGGQIPRWPGWD